MTILHNTYGQQTLEFRTEAIAAKTTNSAEQAGPPSIESCPGRRP
jgi:hypothetical protein